MFDVRAHNGKINVKTFKPGEQQQLLKQQEQQKKQQEQEQLQRQQKQQQQRQREHQQSNNNGYQRNQSGSIGGENEGSNRLGNRTGRPSGPYKKWYNESKPARTPKLEFEIRDDESSECLDFESR